MGFMQPQVTGRQKWIEMAGDDGIFWLSYDALSRDEMAFAESVSGDANADPADLEAELGEYYPGKLLGVEVVEGYGARLSAPGYMDCTDWTVFETQEEAEAYLKEE